MMVMKNNRLAAIDLIRKIEDKISLGDMSSLNTFISGLNIQYLEAREIIALVRGTYRVKDKLPIWKKIYQDSTERLISFSKDPNKLFIGIDP
jgi:hypothetical protein